MIDRNIRFILKTSGQVINQSSFDEAMRNTLRFLTQY